MIRQIQAEPFEINEVTAFAPKKKDGKEDTVGAAIARDLSLSIVKRPESAWATPGKAEWELTASVTSAAQAGPLDGKHIFAKTTIPRLPSLPLPLKGKISAPYTVAPLAPQKLNIKGDAATGTYDAAFATITAEAPVTLEDIHPASAAVVATAEPGATPNEAKLKVTISDAAPAGPIEEDVAFTVTIGGAKYPEHVGVRSYGVKKPPTPQAPDAGSPK